MKDALALALVHFIWQGALLAIAGALLMRVARVPTVRYAIGVATMVAMLMAPVLTFVAIQNAGDPPIQTTSSQGSAASDVRTISSMKAPAAANASREGAATFVIVPTSWILRVWAIGVMVLSLRFAGGWVVARRLAAETLTPVGENLQALAAQLAARLNVRGAVRVCESASVAVPMMLGCLRPVIILPPAAVVSLPLAQLEALLAHEFAHIRRHDYLVNLLQTGVETLCFYHPAVWWISREVRRHREHCCDDLAVGVCDRLTYLTALSSLASIATPQLALSAAGGSLRDRVRRLIEPTTHSASPKGAWIAMLPILLVISFVAPHAWSTQTAAPAIAAPVAMAAAPAAAARTAPEAVPAEQARPSAAAREAEREKAAVRAEQARNRERGEREQAEAIREIIRQTERASGERQTVLADEVRRLIEASKEIQEPAQEVARRRIERARQENEVARFESRLRMADQALARQKELVEKGLATRQSLAAAEEELNQLRLQLEYAKVNKSYQELVQDRESREHEILVERGLVARRNLPMLDAAATLQPEDRLTITIEGEPELPKTFTVRADGSIRFPLLGSIRVQGSTTSQVQTALQKLISDKGLGRNPAVTVSAWRPR